ncbi:MAG: GNAT family N-acetyltransferase [Myxococcales bacterium]|nr:GNAT family N-acetyltransferase [Myxococcales bacterium]
MPAAPGVTIRAARAEDCALIKAFILELAEYERLAHEVVTTEEALRATLFGERPAAEVLIAEVEGEAAAFALFFHSYSTFLARPGLYLEDLFVRPAHRKLGIGAAMMQRLAQVAVERGCGRFEWSVLDWNEPALEFYRRLGAEPMAEWTVQRLTGDALARLASGG